MATVIRIYREERARWPLLFRAAELAACAATGRALFELSALAGLAS